MPPARQMSMPDEANHLERQRVDRYLKIAVVTRFLALAGIVAAIQLPQMEPFDLTVASVFIGLEVVANSAYFLFGFKRWPFAAFHFSGLVDIVALGYLIHMTGGSASHFAPLLSLVIVFNCIFYGKMGVLSGLIPSVAAYVIASLSAPDLVSPALMAVDIGSWFALAFLASYVGEREKKDRRELQETANEAARRTKEIRTIYETSAGIESHFEVEALLTDAVERTQVLASEKWGDVVTSVTLLSPDQTSLTIKRVGGDSAHAGEDMVIPMAVLPQESREILMRGKTSVRRAADMPQLVKMFSLPEEAMFLSLPLSTGSALFGALGIRITNGANPQPSQIEVFETIANHISSALARARLIEGEKKRRAQATSLFELARDLSQMAGIDEVLHRISEAAVEIGEVDVASVALISGDGSAVTKIGYAVAGAEDQDPDLLEHIGDIPLSWLAEELKQNRPILIDDMGSLSPEAREAVAIFGLEALAVFPVSSLDGISAVLTLGKTARSEWPIAQLQVGEALSGLAGVVISNAWIHQEVAERSRENAALFAVAQLVTATLDRQEVLERITAACLEATGATWASIFLVQELALVPQTFRPEPSRQVAWHLEKTEMTPELRSWISTGEAALIDLQSEPTLIPLRSIGIGEKQVLAAPLVIRNEPLGVLLLQRASGIEHLKGVLSGIGLLASAAIDNANRYDAEKEAVAELKKLDRMKNEFVSTASHELRSPLTSITGYAKTLLRRGDEFSDEQRREFLEIIDKQARHLARLVDDLLTVSKMEEGKITMVLHPVDLNDLASHLVDAVRMRSEKHTFRIDVPKGVPPIMADESKLTEIISNLLDNAIKYSPDGGEIAITARSGNGEIEIAVSDQGPGMSKEVLEKVFQRFYQSDDRAQAGGVGLGLYIVQQLVEAHRGRIWASSEIGKGSTFSLALPQRRSTDMVGK